LAWSSEKSDPRTFVEVESLGGLIGVFDGGIGLTVELDFCGPEVGEEAIVAGKAENGVEGFEVGAGDGAAGEVDHGSLFSGWNVSEARVAPAA
jgi:hypothetical protein